MRGFRTVAVILGLLTGGMWAQCAQAAQITGFGNPADDPALAGSTLVNFDSAPTGFFISMTIGDLTISGDSFGHRLFVNENLPGQTAQNSSGRFLSNPDQSSAFTFTFANPVSAFAFNRGAGQINWTLTAYAGDTVVASSSVPGNGNSNAGQYYGLTGQGITRVVLSDHGDVLIRIDNFAYVTESVAPVPEPATWALMIMGLGAAGAMLRSRPQYV